MRQAALDNFRAINVDVRNDTAVVEVRPEVVVAAHALARSAPMLPENPPATRSSLPPHLQVTKDMIKLGNGEQLPYGVCVWSAGNAPRTLTQQLAAQIPEQAQYQPGGRPSKLAVDSYMRCGGSTGGDAGGCAARLQVLLWAAHLLAA